ncbi:similar to Saccharomyces cerevisiae YDL117W CYK3 SH3-domain protein located in the mother-bud neck and the cytokinetic actin ring [Maudiozyma saulgeensis]|uniref:Similar to Saccharomyces cerevisiae YDL117W CYK3 SH3-domain protein located in the mother-bud neck and the cytokinetic actin ring n=1 Tax=Maudiozyma saulgeensis TaxID=1789683 RepID=A0A1X7QZZ5_9SACH|nr:similar to Saccharomyces cerevisiae YDL117W CYK3 SH3-domain protein located in the mother-bud neck and the cytokinetic actin ring [Kazachstania saulgeensis]
MSEVKLPFRVRARYGWSGQSKGDLGFIEGDIMEVTRVTGAWYYGKLMRNTKCAGYFPHNFVTIIQQQTNQLSRSQMNPTGSMTSSSPKKRSDHQDLKQKMVIPDIPNRSTNENKSIRLNRSSRDMKLTNSNANITLSPIATSVSTDSLHSSPSSPAYNSPNSSSPSSPMHDNYISKKHMSRNHYQFYEQYQHQSSPDLGSNRRKSTANTSSNLKPRHQTGNINNHPLPPLPPLPNMSSKRQSMISNRSRGPIKSYSSNDVTSSRSNDDQYSYQRSHHKQQHHYYDEEMEDLSRRSLEGSSRLPYLHQNIASNSFSNSKYMDSSTTDSENSFALMSDFSATSAGSFARHKYAQSFSDSLQRSQATPLSSSNDIDLLQNSINGGSSPGDSPNTSNKVSLSNSNNGQMGNLLRKILPRSANNNNTNKNGNISNSNSYPKLPSLQNLNINSSTFGSHSEAKDWITVKSQVNRSRTLTKYEKHPRYMRALENDRELVLHPQDSIYSGLNTNETKMGTSPGTVDLLLTELNIDYIDQMTRRRCSKENDMKLSSWSTTTFSARYGTTLEKLRGVYIFCTEMFDLVDDNGSSDFSSEPTNLNEILHKKHCTPYQLTWLFKRLANSLGITCEIVIGFLKTPGNDNTEFKYNHCWLRVLINREWRFIDVILGNTTNPIHAFINNHKRKTADDSYFLVEPLKFIYTHIPPREFEQHIVPSIDQLSALYLPLVFPSFFKNDLTLHNFSTALSHLEDSEIYECSLEIPNDIEIFASVVATPDNNDPTMAKRYSEMNLALTQIKKHKPESGRRIAVIKAVLPPGASSGSLYIHSGLRGKQVSIANVHPLSMLVPLEHKREEMKFEFVIRIPSENVQNIETYIKEPQNRYLFVNNEYNFEIIQNPYDGVIYTDSGDIIDDGNRVKNKRQSMAIKSPSGKIYEMKKQYPNTTHGTWNACITFREEGIWTGLIKADSGIGWCPFAEWICIS